MPIAKVGDVNLYYEVHGKGEPLVLIMGYGLRGGHWSEIRDKLAGEYRVIVPDNRGTGRSDKPEIPYTAKMMAEDVAGLLNVLGISAASVFGYSLGGAIAQEFALSYPGRLHNLILGATTYFGRKSIQITPEAMSFLANPDYAKLSAEESARVTIPWMWNEEFVKNNSNTIERFISTCCEYPTPAPALFCQGNAMMTFRSYDRLPDIMAPTLVITGTEDRVIPYENSKLLADRIPGAELMMIEGAGHGIFIGDPTEKVSKAVLDFLHRHSKARANN